MKVLLKMAPYLAIVALVFVLLFQRNTITSRTAERDTAVARVADVTEANKSLNSALEAVKMARVDNDAIATAVAAKLGTNTIRLTETRTIIEKAKRDEPAVRAWSDALVPVSVREALRAREDASAPR